MPPEETDPGSEEALKPQPSADQRDFETLAATPKENHWDAAPPGAVPSALQPRRLAYLPAFRYVFDSNDWFVTVVLGAVCFFIPVIGQVALWGFFYEIVESLYRRPDSIYPKFEFRRFGAYCVRGVWPFVLLQAVQITLQMILQLPIQFSFQGMFMLLAINPQMGGLVLAIGGPILLLFLLLLAIAVSLFTAPMLLRAGLTQDVRQVFKSDWFKGYIRRVWVEEILATLFIMLASVVLLPLGCLLLCYGFLAASVVILIAGAHMKWQIYEIYLERGGEPIPLHPLPAEAPLVQVDVPRL